jgi:hypothetical protein
MPAEDELVRRAMRAARELSHSATSLAAEAAHLSRVLELRGSPEASVAASKASLDSASAAFAIDDMTASGRAPTLIEVLARADVSVDAALLAVQAAKRAIAAARTGAHASDGATSA